jgi:hypothetical protein
MIRHTNTMKELFLSVVMRAKEKYDFLAGSAAIRTVHFAADALFS